MNREISFAHKCGLILGQIAGGSLHTIFVKSQNLQIVPKKLIPSFKSNFSLYELWLSLLSLLVICSSSKGSNMDTDSLKKWKFIIPYLFKY